MGLPALVILGGATLLVSPTLRKETMDFGKGILKKAKQVKDVIFEDEDTDTEQPDKAE